MGNKGRTKRQWLWEFSKRIVVVVTFVYVAAIVFSAGVICLYPDSTAINTFIEKVTEVFVATVVCYAVKAGFENVTKIRQNKNADGDDPGTGGRYERDDI